MKSTELLNLARAAAEMAVTDGAEQARAKVTRSREVRVEWRDGKLDRIRESTSQSLSVALFVDGRFSGNFTSDLRETAVADLVHRAVAMTRHLEPDPHRHLPDASRYAGLVRHDLEIFDPSIRDLTPEGRTATARQLEDAARSAEGKDAIVSVTSWVSDTEHRIACFNTNGFAAEQEGGVVSRGVDVSVRDQGDRRPSEEAYGVCRFVGDLPTIGFLGPEAVRRAMGELGSKQAPTGMYDLVIENRAAPILVRHLLQALAGGSLQQKRSFLEGKLGEQIASPVLTLRDDPHLRRGLASTAWDQEGMATLVRPMIECGVLRAYFLDTYYGSKLDMEPTSGSATNLVWETGKRSAADMLADLDQGLFVTSFLGGNSNPATGDFSLGVKGFLVKSGRIVHPVSEMNIAGNHLELWRRLSEVGSDPWVYSANRTPSLRFSQVQCSGAQ